MNKPSDTEMLDWLDRQDWVDLMRTKSAYGEVRARPWSLHTTGDKAISATNIRAAIMAAMQEE